MHITFSGVVIEGDKRGRELGYPTANMKLHVEIEEGVYVSQVDVEEHVIPAEAGIHKELDPGSESGMTEGKWMPSVTFIGKAETFGKSDYKAETWLIDFEGDLYGKILAIKLLKKLRGNIKFRSSAELVKQMQQDEKEAREYFKGM